MGLSLTCRLFFAREKKKKKKKRRTLYHALLRVKNKNEPAMLTRDTPPPTNMKQHKHTHARGVPGVCARWRFALCRYLKYSSHTKHTGKVTPSLAAVLERFPTIAAFKAEAERRGIRGRRGSATGSGSGSGRRASQQQDRRPSQQQDRRPSQQDRRPSQQDRRPSQEGNWRK
jgi:hypothetical protein